MSEEPQRRAWRRTGLLFLGHFINDGYGNVFAPLLPLLIDRLDLSLAMAGIMGTTRILINSFTQPVFGQIVDRMTRPLLVALAPVLTICAMSLIGTVTTSTQLFLVLIVGGIGTALFHPAAAALVGGAKAAANRGLMMAFFSAGGTMGAAAAPVLIIPFVAAFGTTRTPFLTIPGLTIVLVFAIFLQRNLPIRKKRSQERMRIKNIPRPLTVLWGIIVLRGMAGVAFSNFLAVLVTEKGGSHLIGGAAISIFLLAGALGGLIAGRISDRFGRKVVIFTTILLAAPFLLIFLHGPTWSMLPSLALAGLFLFSSTPVGIVAAQEILPGKSGLVSGVVMGMAWGVAGLTLMPVGFLADRYGLISVMTWMALIPLAAAFLAMFYHDAKREEA
ncbi:MAG: MFS transporter [Candidatus Bipolaricaulota bacterium]|nr:MFS transporter [Candidatus Bipolaricaulota bacterium]